MPVFVGHREAINIEFEKEISAKQAAGDPARGDGRDARRQARGGGYVTPIECVGEYAKYVSRVREDPTSRSGLSLWVRLDNLRKGAR